MSANNNTDSVYLPAMNASHIHLQVELYAVVWSGFLLLVIMLLGLVPNMAILIATRCKQQIRTWRYALIHSLCIMNIFFCLTWIPLNFGVLVTNYYHQKVHFSMCYMHIMLFHFCVAGLVSMTIFLGIQRLSSIWSDTYNKNTSNIFVIIAVVLSWLIGGLCAVAVGVYHSDTYSYAVCINPVEPLIVSMDFSNGEDINLHWVETVLCLVYIAAVVSCFVIFIVLSLLRRRKLMDSCQTRKNRNCNYHGIPSIHGRSEDEDRIIGSTISQPSPTKSSLRENSETKKSSGTLASITKKVCLQEPTADDIHDISDIDDNDDDDKFDLKMRLKLAKRSSGRRHTVANIGHAEAGYKGRRGSMDDQRMGANPTNYQYVRKWSVDIVALQDQLENPKLHPMPLKELVEFRDKKQQAETVVTSKSSLNSGKEAAPLLEKTAEKPEQEDKNVKVKENDLKVIKEQLSEEGGDLAPPSKTCLEDPVSTSSLEVPAITVKHGNHSNTQDEVIIQTCLAENQPDNDIDNKESRDKTLRRIVTVWRSAVLLVVVAACLLPLCILLTLGDHNVSLKYLLGSVLVLQCPIHPILLPWLDSSLEQALRRLHQKMISLRCVCYCNVGKRRRCFGRGPEYS